jgi:hypothetical protein
MELDSENLRQPKLTSAMHEFNDFKVLKSENKVYFRTLEDSNKDGSLNYKDKFHYYFIHFTEDQYAVAEYNPLQVFSGSLK